MRRFFLFTTILCLFMLGCQKPLPQQELTSKTDEQLYVDAKHEFAIKHPQNWQIIYIPVSSPKYRENRVVWNISSEGNCPGELSVVTLPKHNTGAIAQWLETESGILHITKEPQVMAYRHPIGPAKAVIWQQGCEQYQSIAISGQHHDFVVTLKYPTAQWRLIDASFHDTVDSLQEILSPAPGKAQ